MTEEARMQMQILRNQQGYDDDWREDHHGNRYAVQIWKYEPVGDQWREIMREQKPLSKRAQAVWKRLQNPNNFYKTNSVPDAMQELIEAELVEVQGRVISVQACYVPKGTVPYKEEQYPPVTETA